MKRILIKNGLLIDPSISFEDYADILIEGSKILDVSKPGSFNSIQDVDTIDAKDRWIAPGLIDLHVHLREPGQEWKETIKTGSEAAVLGGFTSIRSMPNTKPTNDNQEVTKFILDKAQSADAARVLPIGAISIGLEGKEMAPFNELREGGCVAFSDDGEPVYNSAMMRRALEWAKMLGVPLSCHEEDKSLSCGGCMNESGVSSRLGLKGWPKVAEEVMIARDIELARTTGAMLHLCHVSTARGIELVRRAKNDGIAITAEVTPHHLVLTENDVGDYNTNMKMSPPLRESEDCNALLEGIKDKTVDAVASDHAPHDKDSKQIEFGKAAFGILGLQTSLPLLLEFVSKGLLSKLRAIEVFTSSPAKAFNLPYGRLQRGSIADLVIIDPKFKWRFNADNNCSISSNSPFINREMLGIAESVIVNGLLKVKNRELVVR